MSTWFIFTTAVRQVFYWNYYVWCLKVAQEFYNFIQGKKPEKVKIIVSSHNYECTPSIEEIGDLVARIQATGADIVKVATTALDITDNARMFHIIVNLQVSSLQVMEVHAFWIARLYHMKYSPL